MKYLCLVYLEENAPHVVPDSECVEFDAGLRSDGRCLASEALEPTRTATTLRVRDGRVAITDGPFAETKEQLAGFYLVEAGDLDEALRIAAGIPAARAGSVEVRPIRPIRENVARAAGRAAASGTSPAMAGPG